ncbi:A-kinase-interacting protein 1 isoform 2-T2 [Rhynchocyon petersi]
MEHCLAAAALNGVDRRSLQRSARLGKEVLERAKRRAVNWHSLELPKGSTKGLTQKGTDQEKRTGVDPQLLLPGEKYYASVPEEGGANHVYRYHRGKSELSLCSDSRNSQAEDIAKDLYIEVYPGTYSVTVGSNDLTKKTLVVAVDSGQSVDLVFPI